MKKTLLALTLSMATALPALASLPPLREVKEIDDNMLWVAIALEVSNKCPSIEPRRVKGLYFLLSLKTRAKELGYSEEQITEYVDSREEEARIRALGEDYITAQGFDPKTTEGLCAVGEQEIARSSVIGSFLRSTK